MPDGFARWDLRSRSHHGYAVPPLPYPPPGQYGYPYRPYPYPAAAPPPAPPAPPTHPRAVLSAIGKHKLQMANSDLYANIAASFYY